MALDLRLIAYTPNGASLGALPTPASFDVAMPLNDVPSFQLDYDEQAPRSELIGQPLEIALEYSTDGGQTWGEPPNGRFLYLRDGRDPIKADPYSADGPGYIWALSKARVLPDGTEVEGKRTFSTRSVGGILNDLFVEAQARGAMAGFTWDFTNTKDSANRNWTGSLTIALDLGMDYLQVLNALVQQGLVDFRTQGRKIQLYNPASGELLVNTVPWSANPTSTTAWTFVRGTSSTANGYIRLTITDATASTQAQRITSQVTGVNTIPAVPGQRYRATGEVRESASLPMSARLYFLDDANNPVGSSTTGPQTATNPTTFTNLNPVEAVCPAGATKVQVYYGSDGTGARAVGDTMDFRNLSLTTTAVPAADLSTATNPVSLRYGRDITEAPFRRTWEALSDYAYVRGDGARAEVTNGTATMPWGRWEQYVTGSGIQDEGTLSSLGSQALSLSAEARTEYTRGLDFGRAVFYPFRDYQVGQYVFTALDGATEPDRFRIVQLTIGKDSDGKTNGNVVLNDRFTERDVITARALDALTGGAEVTSGSGTTPAPERDLLAPGVVGGLLSSSTTFTDNGGNTWAQVTVSWTELTINADTSPMTDLDHYEIQRRTSSGGTWQDVGQVPGGTHSWFDSPYVPGSSWDFQVRAVDQNGNRGGWSAPVTQVMTADTTAPGTPTAPTLTVRSGVLLIDWDGTLSGGIPPDFARVEVYVGTTNLFTPTAATMVGALFGAGVYPVPNLPYGSTQYVRLVAVDSGGNKSAGSTTPSIVIPQTTDADIDSLSVAKLQAGVLSAVVTLSGTIRTASSGARVEIDSTGIRAFNATDPNPTVNVQSTGDASFSGTVSSQDYVEGQAGYRFGQADGGAQVEDLNVLDTIGAGLVTADAYQLGSADLETQILPELSRGATAFGTLHTNTNNLTTTETIFADFNIGRVYQGRRYLILFHGHLESGTTPAAGSWDINVRYTNDGTQPTTSSASMNGCSTRVNLETSPYSEAFTGMGWYTPSADYDTVKLAVTLVRASGAGNAHVYNTAGSPGRRFEIGVIDLGLEVNVAGGLNQKSTDNGTSDPGNATAKYTRTWPATWSRSYDGDASARVPDTNIIYHGYYSSTHGDSSAMVGLDYTDMQTRLAGATILAARVTFRVQHAGTGGKIGVLEVGYHSNTATRPASRTGASAQSAITNVKQGGTYSVAIPTTMADKFRTGVATGLLFGPAGDTNLANYGYLYGYGSGYDPSITITYTK